jgi:hypothetical protein
MRTVLEEVHLDGDVVIDAGLVEGEAVLDGDNSVVGRSEEECGRRIGGDVEVGRELSLELRRGRRAEEAVVRALVAEAGTHGDDGIGEDTEGGARIDSIDGVLRREEMLPVLREEIRSEMSTGGESPDAEPVPVDAELGGL